VWDQESYFVGKPEAVYAEITPLRVKKDYFADPAKTLNLEYDAVNGKTLVFTNTAAKSDGWHSVKVIEKFPNKTIAVIDWEDAGQHRLRITDDAGVLLAEGSESASDGVIIVRDPDGLPLATIAYEAGTREWGVTLQHYSKVSSIVYALISGYKTFQHGKPAACPVCVIETK
jgi:hypothetical protein